MKEMRDRVLIPLAIPLVAAGVIVVVVFNLSRVLLALEHRAGEMAATLVAIVIAAAVLFGCTWFSARGQRRSPTLTLAGAGTALVLAGFVGLQAIEEHVEVPDNDVVRPADLVFTAIDIDFEEKEATVAAGEIVVELVNAGVINHSFLFDGVPAFRLEVMAAGDTDTGTVRLDPGTYAYYCDVPGHRAAGMEGILTVTEAAPDGVPADTEAAGAEITAGDIYFEPESVTVPAAPVRITLTNEGVIPHSLLIQGAPAFTKLEVDATGDTDSATLTAPPGTYTYYCDIPGHRAAGMEGTITIE